MLCVPLVELPPLLAQPENVMTARMAKLSAAKVVFRVVFMLLLWFGFLPRTAQRRRCAVHERVACYRTAAEDVFGASFFLSQHGPHLSWPHLSQQSPPCLQQVPQSLVAFIFGWSLSCAKADAAAKVSARRASCSVFMVLFFSLIRWWISGGVVPLV